MEGTSHTCPSTVSKLLLHWRKYAQAMLHAVCLCGSHPGIAFVQILYMNRATSQEIMLFLANSLLFYFLILAPDTLHQSKTLEQVHARDAAYELIPFQQRRALHAQLAQALEQGLKLDHVPPSALAYHWSQACRGVEALHPHTTLQVGPQLYYNGCCFIGGGSHLSSLLTSNLATNLSLHWCKTWSVDINDSCAHI